MAAVYSSINETVDASQLVEDGYYAAPKATDKVMIVLLFTCKSVLYRMCVF